MSPATTRRYRATIQYDGTEYYGFQVQPQQRTIQGELERALAQLTQAAIRVHGAGRTDAGVHAQGQVVHFDAPWGHGCAALQRGMNALLPADIAVPALQEAEQGFDARFSAIRRLYIYKVYNAPVRVPLLGRFAHHVREPLDLSTMQQAAAALEGTHDFAAFGQPPYGQNTVRTLFQATWRASHEAQDEVYGVSVRMLYFGIEANAFLRGMVRRIVGTLLLVGSGILSAADFVGIFEARDISRAAPPAPPCGLCLWRVQYPDTVQ